MTSTQVIERIIQQGFSPSLWGFALAVEDEQLITVYHPSNWMTEEEVETPNLLDNILDDLKADYEVTLRDACSDLALFIVMQMDRDELLNFAVGYFEDEFRYSDLATVRDAAIVSGYVNPDIVR